MKLLILGATGLCGTAITLDALARGHEVVAVHRGTTDTLPEHPALLDYVHDRSGGHRALEVRGPFDAIVDVSARVPAHVADAVRTLDAGQPWWVQISSVSVYADQGVRGLRESDAVAAFDDPVLELRACTDATTAPGELPYAAAKAACERLLLEGASRQGRSTVLRPVVITGAHDATWRAPWWLVRLARGGVAVAPPAEDAVQLVDSRDVAKLALDAIEQRIAGVYNVAPTRGSQTVGSLVEACAAAVRAAGCEPAQVRHLTREQLDANGVEAWTDLPVWLPADSEHVGLVTADTELVEEVFGFTARPLAETMAWVQSWIDGGAGAVGRPELGLAPEREQQVLASC